MKKIDLKSLFVPFRGSVAHKVSAVSGALLLTAGLIFCAHLWLHTPKKEKADEPTSSESFSALEAEKQKVESEGNK